MRNQEQTERAFLEDTRDILIGYDGNSTVESLKSLIDEARNRLSKYLDGKVTEDDV